ncbi:hypothetical protein E4T38_08593 [Aureobasidium subglaciale]|nr:hypothetical protein E4T38_08593 [Aureobasidium subglaciale]KAI5215135.1 hypothetical protein E4T40_08606 [Aureobasidium subglaciale]KAI5218317.1 hypothetical protein E4T41_08459 [Aureobasidium subglaciale]KAI5256005.1 hypothetical protein E4T46_08494 [Aureobasidium subglaciale]
MRWRVQIQMQCVRSKDPGASSKNPILALDSLVPFLCQAAVASPMVQCIILGTASINPTTRKAMEAMARIEKAAHESVDCRLDDGEMGRQDLLSHLLQISRIKGGEVDFGIGEVKLQAFRSAGADTTAIALRSVFYHLLRSPDALVEPLTDFDTATRKGRLSNPPRFAEVSKLPFPTAVIKKAMRLHPSVGLKMPQIIANTGIHVADHLIPKG